jgi:hypothetical protein
MISRIFAFRVLALSFLVLMTMMRAASVSAASPTGDQSQRAASTDSSTQPAAPDFKGTWSGTFFSKHANVPAFTMTVVINPDSQGHLIGSASLNSDCLKDLQLEVSVAGSTIVLSGSDEDGNNITVRGTVDNAVTLLKAKYVLNGSATGRCEGDTGTGNLAKR